MITGCSGQICAEEPTFSDCAYLDWYVCLQYSECGNYGLEGNCSWLHTDSFLDCLDSFGLIVGCTNTEACNYNPQAAVDDGNCVYYNPGIMCDCDETFLDINGDCCSAFMMDDCWVCNGDGSSCSSCLPGYTGINEDCYFQSDLDVLQEFINNSQAGVNPPPYDMSPIELGEQEWENGRLVEFKCSTLYPTYLNYELSGEFPDGFSELNELTRLYINANELTDIPNDIGNLTNLNLLELSGNNFSSLPGSVGNLYNLEWLYIYNNQITYLPESLCNILDNLSSISMEYNLLCSGTYPDCIEEYLSVQDMSNCFDVCEEFGITDIQMLPDTEFGNQLIINLSIPEIELYAPDFIFQTDDEYFSVIDPISSYFFVTGPSILDLHYNYIFDYLPDNHLFSGNINVVTGDNTLTCNLPFNEMIEVGIMGDLNGDGMIDVLDIIILINMILYGEYSTTADLNEDGVINILDIVIYRNIILGNLTFVPAPSLIR